MPLPAELFSCLQIGTIMSIMKLKLKNYWGYLLLAVITALLLYLLLESRQRSKQIDETLKTKKITQ